MRLESKMDHVDTTKIELNQDMDTNILNLRCHSMVMVMCNKQHLSNI